MLNRAGVFAAVDAAIAQARDGGGMCGVLVVRIRRLREAEQVFGYATVDRLCETIAEHIRAAKRPADTLVRTGECDFVLVLPRLRNPQHIQLAAAKIGRLLNLPIDVDGIPTRVAHTIGAAIWNGGEEGAERLCLRADDACRMARRSRDRIHLSAAGHDDVPIGYDELFQALRDNVLQVYLQPMFRLRDGALTGFESLSRWDLQGRGWIAPERFVRLAEKTRLIGELTRWNINTTLRHCAPALARHRHLTCTINLSADLVNDSGIVEQITAALRVWNVQPSSLVVEVTETAFMNSAIQVSEVLHEFKRMGVGIAIDDFGTGYASWTYLQHFPVDYLKIDRSFIEPMTRSLRSQQLVSAMIDLAHRIGADAVAEGVSDAGVLEQLRKLGCDRQQGFLSGPPAPAQEVLAKLETLRAEGR